MVLQIAHRLLYGKSFSRTGAWCIPPGAIWQVKNRKYSKVNLN